MYMYARMNCPVTADMQPLYEDIFITFQKGKLLCFTFAHVEVLGRAREYVCMFVCENSNENRKIISEMHAEVQCTSRILKHNKHQTEVAVIA